MNRYSRYFLAALVFAGLGISSAVWSHIGSARSDVKPISGSDLARTSIHAEATLICREGAEVTLSSQLAGQIERIYVKEGQPVRSGEVVAEIESSEQEAQYEEAEARASKSQIDEKFERANFARIRLLAQQGTISVQQFDQAAHEEARAAAQAAVDKAIAVRLSDELHKTRILAPFDAVVLERFVNDQEEVAIGTPVVKLADLSRTWVQAQVDELDAPRVRLGARVSVGVEGSEDLAWPGRVEYIAPEMTRRTEISDDPSVPTRAQVVVVKISLLKHSQFKLGERLEVAIGAESEASSAPGSDSPESQTALHKPLDQDEDGG